MCLEVVSIFPPLILVKKKKKTLQKAKKLFKVSLLSVSKDSLVNFFRENLSNFFQFIVVFNCDLTRILFLGKVTISASASFSLEQR